MTKFLQELDRSTQIPQDVSSGRRNRVFVIIGMHRSGTSLCSHILTLLGVDMADELSVGVANPKGHFERLDIVALHDELLALFDRTYYSDTHDYPLPNGWWADLRVQPIKERLKACLSSPASRSTMFGFKDPRTTKLIPLWNQIFLELQMDPNFIICIRNPADVAVSLKTRDRLEFETGELRTIDYLVDGLRYTKDRRRCLIIYDDWFIDSMINTKKLLSFVGSPTIATMQDLQLAVENVVSPDLNRSGRVRARPSQQLAHFFFEKLRRLVEAGGSDASLESQIELFTQNYVSFRQSLGPFERSFRKAAEKQQALAEAHAASESKLKTAHQQLRIARSNIDKEKEALTISQEALSEQIHIVQTLTEKLDEVVAANLLLEKTLAETHAVSNFNLQAAHQQIEVNQSNLDLERAALAVSREAVNEMSFRVQTLETKLSEADIERARLLDQLLSAQTELGGLRLAQNEMLRSVVLGIVQKKQFVSNTTALEKVLLGHLDFDRYLDENPDVRVVGMHPAAHYIRFGATEGRPVYLKK